GSGETGGAAFPGIGDRWAFACSIYSKRRPAPLSPRPAGGLSAQWLIGAERPAAVAKPEIGQNSLPGNRGLTFRDQRFGAFGQVNVETRSEADQPEPLARADRRPFANKQHH